MSLAHLYHVPYSGNIEQITESRARVLAANENAEVSRIYDVQTARLGDKVDYLRGPAIAGGLLARCPASEVQGIYDAVFGGIQVKSANTLQLAEEEKPASFLREEFEESAKRFNVASMFSKVATPVAANSGNRAPERTFEAA